MRRRFQTSVTTLKCLVLICASSWKRRSGSSNGSYSRQRGREGASFITFSNRVKSGNVNRPRNSRHFPVFHQVPLIAQSVLLEKTLHSGHSDVGGSYHITSA